MKKIAWVLTTALVVIVVFYCFVLLRGRYGADPPDGHISLRYSFLVQNTTNKPIKNARLAVVAPIGLTPSQACTQVKTNLSYSLHQDNAQNQFLQFYWDMIPPLTTRIIKIDAEVDIWRQRQKKEAVRIERFLAEEPFIESESPLIRSLAAELEDKKPLHTARNIHDWIVKNLEYSGYIKKTRGARYAVKHRKGDCTEFAALFVALCRANNIPSRFLGGFVCSKSMVLDLGDYHNWAEFYADGQWRLADPQRNIFMRDEWTYIAFQVIRTSTGNQGSLIGNVEGDGLKVKLKT